MGLYGAMTTAVAGLSAQSYALENISGNIANSQTTGFKRVDTSFSDIVMSFGASAARQNSGSVLAQSRSTNMIQGSIESSAIDTYMAISGDGYFQVQKKIGESDGNEVFSGANVYTRRGDFSMDKQGYLVNGAGYYLKAIPIDPSTGNPVGDVAEVFQLTLGYLAANPSTKIDLNANLPAGASILDQSDFTINPALTSVAASPAVAASATGTWSDVTIASGTYDFTISSELGSTSISLSDTDSSGTIDIGEAEAQIAAALGAGTSGITVTNDGSGNLVFASSTTGAAATISVNDPGGHLGFGTSAISYHGTNAIAAGAGTVNASESKTFVTQSLDGGSSTLYDSQGTAKDVQFRWAKMKESPDTWNLFYESDPDATGTGVQWTNVGTNFVFDDKGNLSSPSTGEVTVNNMTIGASSLGNIVMNFGDSGLTQYSASTGTVDVTLIDQDGYASGSLSSVGVGDSGRISATYSNGQQIDVAEVPLYKFNADQQLKRMDGSAFAETRESGTALQMSTTNITGGALEASNTDIAEEFSKMIVTQQAYSANSKIISTADTMMQSILSIIR